MKSRKLTKATAGAQIEKNTNPFFGKHWEPKNLLELSVLDFLENRSKYGKLLNTLKKIKNAESLLQVAIESDDENKAMRSLDTLPKRISQEDLGSVCIAALISINSKHKSVREAAFMKITSSKLLIIDQDNLALDVGRLTGYQDGKERTSSFYLIDKY